MWIYNKKAGFTVNLIEGTLLGGLSQLSANKSLFLG